MLGAEGESVAGALLAEPGDIFDVKHQFHGDLPGFDALCSGMDHYVCAAVECHQFNNSVTRQTEDLKTEVFFVEGNGCLDVAGVEDDAV